MRGGLRRPGIIGKRLRVPREKRLLRAVKRKKGIGENGADVAGSAEDVKASADGTPSAGCAGDRVFGE